jgi:mRNA interferase RelE/StbE
MPYSIEYAPAAYRQINKIPNQHVVKILEKIEELSENPRPAGVIKLKGTKNEYRLRIGNYRVVYIVEKARMLVLIVKIADRKEIYRNL